KCRGTNPRRRLIRNAYPPRSIYMSQLHPETVDRLPSICGDEAEIAQAMAGTEPIFLPQSGIDFARVQTGTFAIALHMHQPMVPAGSEDLQSAAIISNLQHMMEHPEIPDAHNAPVFRECYRRMGEYVPQLVSEGKQPRVMLDYS